MTASNTPSGQSEQSTEAPSMTHTGLGYEYFRCHDRKTYDDTVYVHQLLACLEYDPHSVFDPASEVKRLIDIPWLNVPENLHLTLCGRFDFPEQFEAQAEEPSKAGVPVSEYHRLHEVALEEGRSEVSQTLRQHMKQYRAEHASD